MERPEDFQHAAAAEPKTIYGTVYIGDEMLARKLSLAQNNSHSRPAPLPRQTLVGSAVRDLRKRIISGEFKDGEPLNQVVIAREYTISRIPLREAMRQLEAEGLLVFQPGRGAVVSSLSLDEIREVIDLRANLETKLIVKAIPHLTTAVLNDARNILDQFDSALGKGQVETWGEINWRFHSTLCAPSGLPLTMGILENLHHLNQRYAGIQISFSNWEQRAVREHHAILNACRKRDSRKAATLLKQHIVDAGEALLRILKEQRSER